MDHEAGRSFVIQLRTAPGTAKPAVAGFQFNGDFYQRVGNP